MDHVIRVVNAEGKLAEGNGWVEAGTTNIGADGNLGQESQCHKHSADRAILGRSSGVVLDHADDEHEDEGAKQLEEDG